MTLTNFVAVARNAVSVGPLVKVGLTALTVRSIPISSTVQTMAAMPRSLIELDVEEATVRKVVAVAGCRYEDITV